jgi:hypothetical protein
VDKGEEEIEGMEIGGGKGEEGGREKEGEKEKERMIGYHTGLKSTLLYPNSAKLARGLKPGSSPLSLF